MRFKKIVLLVYLVLLARHLFGQQPGTNAHIFNTIPNSTRSTVGQWNLQDLQNPPFNGGWIAPNLWLANNLRWKMPTNDFEGCMTSTGALVTKWNDCAHIIAKNLDCPAASASAAHYTCSTENTFTPVTGDMVYFKFDVAPSASADLSVNGSAAKPIVDSMTLVGIAANAASIGSRTWCKYDGTNWQCILGATLPALGAHQIWIGPTPTAKTIPDCQDTGGNHLNFTQSTDTFSCGTTVSTSQLHVITFSIDGGGSVISTGDIGRYPTAHFACTIVKAMISADVSGSIAVDIWKTNAAIPTSSNKISASAPVTLSSAQLNQNSSLSGWTTSVSSDDVFGFSVATSTTVTKITGQIWCQ